MSDLSQIPTEQLLAMLQGGRNPAAQMPDMNPTIGMSGPQKFLAGTGKAFADAGRGVAQLAGYKSRADIDEAKKLDAPLMRTGSGIAGNIAGNAALFAPAAAIPGANTLAGAGLVGAAAGALQPVGTQDSRLLNTGLSAGAGVLGQAAGNAIGRAITPVSSRLSPEMQQLAQGAEREGIPLSIGQKLGSRPLQIAESVMENLPLTSAPQLAQREAQQRAFTAAALTRAGMSGDVATAPALAGQKAALGGALGDVAKRNSLGFNQGLTDRLASIVADAEQHLPQEMSAKVASTVDKVLGQVDQAGAMSGTNYQGWREPLRGLAGDAGTGRYFRQIRSAMDESFRTQLPGAEGEAFRGTSRQYANLKTVIDAMGGAGNLPAQGQVAPAQLSAALARAMGREGKALGAGDMNELSRIGQSFVRDQIPNSGTAQRQFIQNVLTGNLPGIAAGAGVGYYEGRTPEAAALGAGAGLGASLGGPRLAQVIMQSGAGQKYLSNQVLSAGARKALADALRTGAIAGAPELAAIQR